MYSIIELDNFFNQFAGNISKWLPEDIVNVDHELLKKFNLADKIPFDEPPLTRHFHVIESHEKITLFNEEFIVWIVPEKLNKVIFTYTLVARNLPSHPQLELCFVTSDVHNNSRLVLQVLEKFLQEIQKNEEAIRNLR